MTRYVLISCLLILCIHTPGSQAAVEWREVADGIHRTQLQPHAYAIVDGDRCLMISAPYHVSPSTLPRGVQACELVLLTHHHRDSSGNAGAFVRAGISVRAPKLSEAYLSPTGVAAYWEKSMPVAVPDRFPPLTERYWNDWTYLVHPTGIANVRFDIGDGEIIDWRGWKLSAVSTPGHSRDHMAFLASRKSETTTGRGPVCFAGDAIASPGKIWSPYTLEWHHQKDEGAVAASVSIRTIVNSRPDVVLPEHGDPLRGSDLSSQLLETADRLQQLGAAKNYDAYTRGLGNVPQYSFLAREQVGSANPQGNPVPWSKLSPHLFLSGNIYALVSKEGPVLLMDPYSRNVVERIAELKRDHGAGPVEVAMVSHAHNDHYTGLFAIPDRASCQVWTLKHVADVIQSPYRYLAPYVDPRVPKVDRELHDQQIIPWHEYELKIHHLPGQTTFAMGVELHVDGKHCLFAGDNFYHHEQYSGSGGWSGRNRGLPNGYMESIDKILAMQPDWILAEHGGAFEFDRKDFQRRLEFMHRAGELADSLSPHDDYRVDWDPQRVRAEPLIVPASHGGKARFRVIANNPLPRPTCYRIQSISTKFFDSAEQPLTLEPGKTSSVEFEWSIPNNAPVGRHVIPFLVDLKEDRIDSSDTFVVIEVQ